MTNDHGLAMMGAAFRQFPFTDPPRVAIDDAIELMGVVGSGDQHAFVTVASIAVMPGVWRLDPSWSWMRDRWDSRHPAERSGNKVGLRTVRFGEEGRPSLRLTLQMTEWREARSAQEVLETDQHGDLVSLGLSSLCVSGESMVVNLLSVHCIVETADGYLVLVRRPKLATFHPLHWSASIEEGLEPPDLDAGNDVFFQAARRGLLEELLGLGFRGSLHQQLLGLLVELPILNPCVAVYTRIPVSHNELARVAAEAPDRAEVFDQGTVPFDPDTMARFLTHGRPRGGGVMERAWHPTARYRILAAMVYRFGWETTQEALRRTQV